MERGKWLFVPLAPLRAANCFVPPFLPSLLEVESVKGGWGSQCVPVKCIWLPPKRCEGERAGGVFVIPSGFWHHTLVLAACCVSPNDASQGSSPLKCQDVQLELAPVKDESQASPNFMAPINTNLTALGSAVLRRERIESTGRTKTGFITIFGTRPVYLKSYLGIND